MIIEFYATAHVKFMRSLSLSNSCTGFLVLAGMCSQILGLDQDGLGGVFLDGNFTRVGVSKLCL